MFGNRNWNPLEFGGMSKNRNFNGNFQNLIGIGLGIIGNISGNSKLGMMGNMMKGDKVGMVGNMMNMMGSGKGGNLGNLIGGTQ